MSNINLDKSNKLSTNTILFLFIGIWSTSVIGFHHAYTSKFPNFEGVSSLIHFHGTVMMLWYVLLFAKVFLIKFNKNEWNKLVDYFAFALGPLVVYTIFLVTKMQYIREITKQPEQNLLAHLTVEIPLMLLFATFFVLAMANRKNQFAHTRYIIATALVMIGPGLGRAIIYVFGLHPIIAIITMFLLPTIIASTFLYFDYKNKRNTKPFKTITILLFTQIVCGLLQMTIIWQGFAKWFANTFFI